MNSVFGKLSYKLITHSLRMPVFSLINEFEHAEQMPPDELLQYQWNKLQELIKYAVAHSPYYKKLFADIGAEAEDIKDEASFQKIPILTKDIIRKGREKILLQQRPRGLIKAKTSGSMGTPLIVYKDSIGRASTYAAMYRGHGWHDVDIGEREARLWGIPLTPIAKWKMKLGDVLLNRFRQKDFQVSEGTYRDFYDKIKKFHPVYLMGYPSLIYDFANFITQADLDGKIFNLKFVKTTAEVTPDYQKELIESIFDCPCISEYGSAETGVVSFECPARNHHIMAESVFVEFEKSDLMKNEMKKLIVTNLYSFVFPIIRYEIGDLAYPIDAQCSCGRSLPLMSKVIGRTSDVVIGTNDKRFHSAVFSYLIKNFIELGIDTKWFRFLQTKPGRVEMQIVRSKSLTCDHIKLMKRIISNFFGDDLLVGIKYVSCIPKDPSGKFRYFISYIDN